MAVTGKQAVIITRGEDLHREEDGGAPALKVVRDRMYKNTCYKRYNLIRM